MKSTVNTICIFILVLLLFESDWNWNILSPPKPDMVAVVYESSDNIPEPYVTGALNELSSQGIQARVFDKDVVNGNNQIPKEVEKAVSEAQKNGLPALVVLGGGNIISVQNLPKTKDEIMGAVK